MISSFQFFYVLIGKEGVARKLILLFQLSWINQESVICGSQHFFHPAEEDLLKLFFLAALISSKREHYVKMELGSILQLKM